MSKYSPLWNYVLKNAKKTLTLSFSEIESILGMPIDHSFLKYKKELTEYGYRVSKISIKQQTVLFEKSD